MGKKSVFTRITPLPKNVPRQLALDMLHSHEEIIRLNPLVTDVKAIEAPREAPSEEYFSSWYEIFETVTVGLGYKKKISFKTVFHDQPWGCQTHSYAPFGVDLRNKYRVGGNQPGEPREVKELGIDTPLDGLYIREDVEIICNIPLTTNFVKKETKEAIGIMVDRISRKAELLDEGKLHAMFENGMLKTAKPNMDPTFDERPIPSPHSGSPPGSPAPSQFSRADTYSTHSGLKSPPLDAKGFGRYRDIAREGSVREGSIRSSQYIPAYQQSGYGGPQHTNSGAGLPGQGAPTAFVSELPASTYFVPQDQQQQQQQQRTQQYPKNSLYPQPLKPGGGGMVFRSELPGDTYMPAQAQQQPQQQQQQQPASQESKPHPPLEHQHPANRSPSSQQNSPALQPRPLSETDRNGSSQSAYRVANPDTRRPDSGQARQSSSSVQQWQASLQADLPIEDSYYRNARSAQGQTDQQNPQSQQSTSQQQQRSSWQQRSTSQAGDGGLNIQPDHQRFARMSMQEPGSTNAQNGGAGRISKCPVCGMFEGDEVAVSHHVSKAHFQ